MVYFFVFVFDQLIAAPPNLTHDMCVVDVFKSGNGGMCGINFSAITSILCHQNN